MWLRKRLTTYIFIVAIFLPLRVESKVYNTCSTIVALLSPWRWHHHYIITFSYVASQLTFQSYRSRAMSNLGFFSLAAASIPSPRGPQPDTTTTSSNSSPPSSTACMEQASGSMKAAFHAGIDWGTWMGWGERTRDKILSGIWVCHCPRKLETCLELAMDKDQTLPHYLWLNPTKTLPFPHCCQNKKAVLCAVLH